VPKWVKAYSPKRKFRKRWKRGFGHVFSFYVGLGMLSCDYFVSHSEGRQE